MHEFSHAVGAITHVESLGAAHDTDEAEDLAAGIDECIYAQLRQSDPEGFARVLPDDGFFSHELQEAPQVRFGWHPAASGCERWKASMRPRK